MGCRPEAILVGRRQPCPSHTNGVPTVLVDAYLTRVCTSTSSVREPLDGSSWTPTARPCGAGDARLGCPPGPGRPASWAATRRPTGPSYDRKALGRPGRPVSRTASSLEALENEAQAQTQPGYGRPRIHWPEATPTSSRTSTALAEALRLERTVMASSRRPLRARHHRVA